LIIKPIIDTKDIKQVAQVEAETWGMRLLDTVPDHVLTAVARDGGVLLGAYQDDRLIGFTLGWLGLIDPESREPAAKKLKLVSHMTGVLEAYRDQRVGYQLKLAQRDWALSRGLNLVTWTYDPLESRNGNFNIHLLGCVCQTYLEDYYGEMSDQMNEGVPSDRFRADWWIASPEVKSSLSGKRDQMSVPAVLSELETNGYQLINPPRKGPGDKLRPGPQEEPAGGRGVLVEIPVDYQALRNSDLDLALAWRIHTREIFQLFFARGYQVVDFIYQKPPHPRSFYLLEKDHED